MVSLNVYRCTPLHSKSAHMADILPINSDTVAENSSLDKMEGEVTPEDVIEVSEGCCNESWASSLGYWCQVILMEYYNPPHNC